MEHASWHKAGWLRAFVPESGVLHCVGTLEPRRRAVHFRQDRRGFGILL